MARIDNLSNFLTDIATAIKSKTGKTEAITPSNFDTEINSIEAGGGNIEEYFETTITSSNYTNFATRNLIKKLPLIKVEYENLQNSFESWNYSFVPELDTSGVTRMYRMFYQATRINTIPQYDTSNVNNMAQMFAWTSNIESIPELNGSSLIDVSNMFQGSKNSFVDFGGLKNLGMAYLTTSSANYSAYKLDLSTCPNLSHDSLMNVINGLYDIASIGVQVQQLVLGSTNLAKLTEEEKNIAVSKGWNIS